MHIAPLLWFKQFYYIIWEKVKASHEQIAYHKHLECFLMFYILY